MGQQLQLQGRELGPLIRSNPLLSKGCFTPAFRRSSQPWVWPACNSEA